jgi:hypothetical protein
VAQGKVGGLVAALGLLALLGLRLLAFAGCWGERAGGGIGSNVGVLAAACWRWDIVVASLCLAHVVDDAGQSWEGAATLVLLALLGMRSSAMAGCWG